MAITRVAGVGLDGSANTITVGTVTMPFVNIKYGDKLNTEWQPTIGSQERGEQSRGMYEAVDVELELTDVVFRTLWMPAFPVNGAGNIRFPIVVSKVHPDLGDDSDLIEGCRWIGSDAAVEASSKVSTVPIKCTCALVRWTDARKTIHVLDGQEQSTANGLGV
jgi:hypothetical protein